MCVVHNHWMAEQQRNEKVQDLACKQKGISIGRPEKNGDFGT
jgi:hypothetical protein